MTAHDFEREKSSMTRYELRRKADKERAKRLATKATSNGIKVTFPTDPVKGELDFTKNLRRAIQ